jgi:hypothetical protein
MRLKPTIWCPYSQRRDVYAILPNSRLSYSFIEATQRLFHLVRWWTTPPSHRRLPCWYVFFLFHINLDSLSQVLPTTRRCISVPWTLISTSGISCKPSLLSLRHIPGLYCAGHTTTPVPGTPSPGTTQIGILQLRTPAAHLSIRHKLLSITLLMVLRRARSCWECLSMAGVSRSKFCTLRLARSLVK